MTVDTENTLKLVVSQEATKQEIRKKVWQYLKDSGLTTLPLVPKRITNFKGSEEAGSRAAELEIFKKATVVRVDPVRPLLEIRIKALEAGKTLMLPTPRLLNHVYSKVVPPKDADQKTLKSCISREGLREFSTPIDLDDKVKIDLVIVGCIAVSTRGHRIGKGGGLSDLEYGMLASLGVVDANVPVITIVHDDQVVDLPDGLFQEHDLPVDFIVTPTRVIECTNGPKKPTGIIWSLINEDSLNHVPVLRRLRYRDMTQGKDVRLKDEETQPSELVDVVLDESQAPEQKARKNIRNRRNVRRRRDAEEGETTGDEEKKENSGRRKQGRNRYNSYRNRNQKTSDRLGSDGVTDDEKKKDVPNGDLRPGRRPRRIKNEVQGSVYVGSLPRSLRVSQFKSRVRERMVNPLRVLWKGNFGFAFLNFKTHEDAEQALAALEGLSISDRTLKLEMAKSATGRRSKEVPKVTEQGDGDKQVD